MTEITKIYLENEMDLILSYKKSMKLAELIGMSVAAQTSFGTAVSEACRFVMTKDKQVVLILSLDEKKGKNLLLASIAHSHKTISKTDEALVYAGRLVAHLSLSIKKDLHYILLEQSAPSRQKYSVENIDEWKSALRNEAPFSPYEEVKMKNMQLKDLTEQLAKSESRYRALAESLPLAIFSSDGQGKVDYVNKWLKDFSGQDLSDINASDWTSFIHADDVSIMDKFNEAGDSDIRFPNGSSEFRVKDKDGNYIWHVGSSILVGDSSDVINSYKIGYFVDIQAQKQVEETLRDNKALKEAHVQLAHYQSELEARLKELDRRNTELGHFAFIASHDLQEPLRKLQVYSDYILKKFSVPAAEHGITHMLDKIVAACGRMRSLIKAILDFSMIGEIKTEFSLLDLNNTIGDVLEGLDHTIQEKNAGFSIGPLPTIEANGILIQQLLSNILSNSLKYARQDVKPQINIYAETDDKNTIIHIVDNGIGFENQYVDKIFGLFQRLHSWDEINGTGIGLAICKKIVELHKGTIDANGELGKGAHFKISMPLKQNES